MITPRLHETLDKEERLLWHSHDYEARAQHPSSYPSLLLPSSQPQTKDMSLV